MNGKLTTGASNVLNANLTSVVIGEDGELDASGQAGNTFAAAETITIAKGGAGTLGRHGRSPGTEAALFYALGWEGCQPKSLRSKLVRAYRHDWIPPRP
ncbi:MAG: hypothetical protein LBS64_00655 [Spirochaetaceae bacterium]|nr:hypothetical protein [Spirochaetaceae bacterium]